MVFLDRDGLSLTPDDETRCQSSSEERRICGRNHSARAWSPGVGFLKKLTSQCVASVLQKHFRFPPEESETGESRLDSDRTGGFYGFIEYILTGIWLFLHAVTSQWQV